MNYKENDIVKGIALDIRSYGVYIQLEDTNSKVFLPREEIKYGIENGVITIKPGQYVTAAIKRISDDFIFLSHFLLDEIKDNNEQASLVQSFISQCERGEIFEAEVVSVKTNEVKISIQGLIGNIKKEELNYNVIESPSDIVFEGEVLKVVYLGLEDGELQFSTKYLNPIPYNEELYKLDLISLLQLCNIKSNVFVGRAKKMGNYTFLENLYSLGDNKGALLVDPYFGYNLRAIVPQKNKVKVGEYYLTEIDLFPIEKRIERHQLFQFVANNIHECENPFRLDVDRTFKKLTDPAANLALSKTLAEFETNNNITKDRMFFELIQNADDASAEKGVSVYVTLTDKYLVFCHNGYSFSKEDFEAITSSANGTKRENENKTGYKGIGFKSVFKDSEEVTIKSGGYQFKFDRNYPLYIDFIKYYSFVNNLQTSKEINDFCELYDYEKRRFEGNKTIPWQLKPIWIDSLSDDLENLLGRHNVSIALKLKPYSVDGENGYKEQILSVLKEPKFMLFLRNTNRITMSGMTIQRDIEGSKIVLKNSFCSNKVEEFERFDYHIDVDNKTFEKKNIDIRIKEKRDEGTGDIVESTFVNTKNQELEEIPPKIAYSRRTTISFAVPVKDMGIEPDKKCQAVSLYAYLPTIVQDFKFPFFVNANFLLDSERQHVLGDNSWNIFLMHMLGEKLVEWCATLCSNKEHNALNILKTKYFDETNNETNQLARSFNESYKNALNNICFVLNSQGVLVKQSEIILDKTGLSNIIGEGLFCKILDTNKKLPSTEIDYEILESEIFELIEKLRINDVVPHLIDSEIINNWYISATRQEQGVFLEWLEKHEEKCLDVIKTVPFIKFGDEYRSCNFVADNSHYIILKDFFASVKPILNKLGIICSDEIITSENFIHSYLPKLTSNDIFDLINNQFKKFIKCDSIIWEYDNCGAYRGLEIDIANAFVKAHLLSKKNHHELIESQQRLTEIPEEFYDQDYDYFLSYVIPNLCRQQLAESTLLKTEKTNLLGVIKKLKIDDSDKKSLIIFKNTENNYVPIGNMLPYREDAPSWIRPYMVNKDEYSEELDDLLINDENRYVWENMLKGSFNVSINDIYSFYPWTDENYTRKLIDAFKADEKYNSLIDIVEKSGIDTKKYYLEQISRIDLYDEKRYMEDSWEYRVLQLAVSTLETPSELSSKIYYKGQCIITFSTSDDVVCKYNQDGKEKRLTMSLAKLLPLYKVQSNSIDIIKNLFEKKNILDKFFVVHQFTPKKIVVELENLLGLKPGEWPYDAGGNALQYLFYVYYYRGVMAYTSSWVISIDLNSVDFVFVKEMFDFLYENDIDIKNSPFTYRINKYIIDKFFSIEYILIEDGLLLPSIEKWADTDDKKNYLKRNGVKGSENAVVTLRKHFINDEPCTEIEDLLSNALAINKMLHFLSVKDSLIRPFTGENQKEAFKALRNGRNGLSVETDVAKLEQNWTDFNDHEYDSWRQKTGKPEIRLYKGLIPRYFEYEKVRLADFEEGNYFETPNRHIYINANIDRQEILSQLVSDSKIHFYSDDFFELCFKGKQAVSKEEWEELKESNKDLEENNKRLEEENKRLREELKNLGNKSRDKRDNVEMEASGGPDIDTDTKINAQLEAQRKLMEIYPNWIYPEGFTKGDIYSTFQIVDDQGNKMSIVLKSYKKHDVKFHINPNEWDYLMDGAKLFIYRGDDIFELEPKYLIENQPSIGLSFSTENLDLEERVGALSEALHYFKQITFDFSSFNLSEKAESIKEMYNKNHKKQNDFDSQDY